MKKDKKIKEYEQIKEIVQNYYKELGMLGEPVLFNQVKMLIDNHRYLRDTLKTL